MNRGAAPVFGALCALVFATTSARAEPTHHTVEDGETLSSIAEQHFGNPHLWPAIYRANRDQIKHPAHLYPGQSLLVPAVSSTARPRADGAGAPTLERESQ